mmetsp:Transcript_5601/g.7835  ORF Transcript_5601/g.7835 Transcript_5601/m.7835 type:complete len:230 (-) Transcript_5601:65-754(-)
MDKNEISNSYNEGVIRTLTSMFIGKDFAFLPREFTFKPENVSIDKLEVEDHVWVESEKKHIIILGQATGRFQSGLAIDETAFKVGLLRDLTKATSVQRLNYKECCLKIQKSSRIAEILEDFQPKRCETWGPTQYAFFCKTGGYLTSEQFQRILKDPEDKSQNSQEKWDQINHLTVSCAFEMIFKTSEGFDKLVNLMPSFLREPLIAMKTTINQNRQQIKSPLENIKFSS